MAASLQFGVEWIRRRLSEYNANEANPFSDYVIAGAFDRPLSIVSVAELTSCIAVMWNVQGLPWWPAVRAVFDADGEVAARMLATARRDLREFGDADQVIFHEVAASLFRAIGRNDISFVAKYLHWRHRSFWPAYDRFALFAANAILDDHVRLDADWRERYGVVLRATRQLWRSLTDDQVRTLLAEDLNMQPTAFRWEVFPLRLFDKALWMEGRELDRMRKAQR